MTLNLFKYATDTVPFGTNEVIFEQGETGDTMFVVVEGQVDILRDNVLVETVEAGGVFGELALIDYSPRAATAIARTDVRLAEITRKRFAFMIQETPNFALTIMEAITERLRRAVPKPH